MIWLVAAAGLLITVFGATAGASLVAVSRAELAQLVSRQLKGERGPLPSLLRTERLLAVASATTSLGVVVLGTAVLAAASTSEARLLALVLVVAAVPAVVFGGYLFPRVLTQPRAERVARWVRPALRAWSAPLAWFLPSHVAVRPSDLRALWREGAATGLQTDENLWRVGRVMTFAQRPVREVMTPRTDLVAVPEDAAFEDIRQVFIHSGYSRLPVFRVTPDEIIGMVHAFDLFRMAPGSPLPIRPVAVSPASRTCGDLLLDMQRERRHLAVVLDEFGGTEGIVTLEDILEELVGEIFDEDDGAPPVSGVPPGAEVFEADGTTAIDEIEERFGVTFPRAAAASIGGLIAELAGRIPRPGERFVIGDLEIDVVAASPAKIERLFIRPGPVPAISLSREPL